MNSVIFDEEESLEPNPLLVGVSAMDSLSVLSGCTAPSQASWLTKSASHSTDKPPKVTKQATGHKVELY